MRGALSDQAICSLGVSKIPIAWSVFFHSLPRKDVIIKISTMPTIEIIGLIAAVLTTSAFAPQVYKVWKTKSTNDISLTMYLGFFVGVLLWFYYGLQIDSLSMMIANGVTALLALVIIFLKLKYK